MPDETRQLDFMSLLLFFRYGHWMIRLCVRPCTGIQTQLGSPLLIWFRMTRTVT